MFSLLLILESQCGGRDSVRLKMPLRIERIAHAQTHSRALELVLFIQSARGSAFVACPSLTRVLGAS